ncbi:MAG: exodeoxyribonuclease VII large subunit [Acidiferrobacterales bacterium]
MPRQPRLPSSFRDVYTVSRLAWSAKRLLESGFPALIWVEGEISNLSRPASGHIYFSLKDDQSQIRCALFRTQQRNIDVVPGDGSQVVVRARVSLYEGRGEFQLIVERLEEAGEGALRRALEALKQRLSQEGLFDVAHKKSLPRLPKRIGVITSPAGAVFHDIVITLRRRFPAISMLLYPVPVQGDGAAQEITAAIGLASRRKDCDALVLTRGGGSLEDLSAFNDESVVRAIFACQLPIVCGVGHETDVTLSDLVADVRAPTPTAAAELLSPDQYEWAGAFEHKVGRIERLARDAIATRQQKLDWLVARLAHPKQRIGLLSERLESIEQHLHAACAATLYRAEKRLLTASAHLKEYSPEVRIREFVVRREQCRIRLLGAMRHVLAREKQRLRAATKSLNNLSPLATLERGYAIVTESNSAKVITDAAKVQRGERVEARLARGQLSCRVEETLDDADVS